MNQIAVRLQPAKTNELDELKRKIQESFAVSVEETFGPSDEPIPSDKDLEKAFYGEHSAIYHFVWNGKKVGGVVLSIDGSTNHNAVDFLFVSPEYHSKGIGTAAWTAIEKQYPETVVWNLATPYFEKRNIHFYVNKCGFKIVAFWNRFFPDPHTEWNEPEEDFPEGSDEMFYFEKIMK